VERPPRPPPIMAILGDGEDMDEDEAECAKLIRRSRGGLLERFQELSWWLRS